MWSSTYAVALKKSEYIEPHKVEKPRYKEGLPYCLNCGKNREKGMIRCPEPTCNQSLRTKGNRRKHWVFKRI